MDWAGIQWARDHGYRYYDFGGIDYEAALPNSDLQTARDTKKDGVRSYKEGYRGEIVVFPEPRAYIHLHSLKLVYRLAGTIKLPKLTSR
jgi:lipid II:glycine glycyltransferase (peptidoglycan interpeptide bridge formation enzyme)